MIEVEQSKLDNLEMELIQTQKRLLETQLSLLYYKERELVERTQVGSQNEILGASTKK